MTIGYNDNIPFATHNPSTDQPLMLQNTNAISQILGVDHVTFGDTDYPNGQHQQVNFVTTKAGSTIPSTPTDPASVEYTQAGALNTSAQCMFKNASAAYMMSCIRAFGVVTIGNTPGAVTVGNGMNVVSASVAFNPSTLTVTLENNAIYSSSNIGNLIAFSTNSTNGAAGVLSSVSANQVQFQGFSANTKFSFVLIQN